MCIQTNTALHFNELPLRYCRNWPAKWQMKWHSSVTMASSLTKNKLVPRLYVEHHRPNLHHPPNPAPKSRYTSRCKWYIPWSTWSQQFPRPEGFSGFNPWELNVLQRKNLRCKHLKARCHSWKYHSSKKKKHRQSPPKKNFQRVKKHNKWYHKKSTHVWGNHRKPKGPKGLAWVRH